MKKTLAFALALILLLQIPALAAPLNLLRKDIYPTVIRLNKASITLTSQSGVPASEQLIVTTTPALETLTDPTVKWRSLDPAVATVTDGLVTAVGTGKTRVIASIRTASGVLKVGCAVTSRAVAVKSVQLDMASLRLNPSKASERTARLTATVLPANASFPALTWTSSDESVATVDASGLVTAISTGAATIRATTSNGKVATCAVISRDLSKMTEIVVTATGDVVLGGDKARGSYQRFKNFITDENGNFDWTYTFKNFRSLFEQDDITIVNLEGPLTDRGSPSHPDSTYSFCAPPEYAQILKAGSIEMANIVNNHIRDYPNGYTLTKRALKDYGIGFSDGELVEDSNIDSRIVMVDGVRVGVIGIQTPRQMSSIGYITGRSKKRCDVLIVCFHFCEVPEYYSKVKGSQIAAAHTAINNGADMVIGTHPHVYSGIEEFKGKYIYYDLGSLVMAGENGRHKTYVAQQSLYYDKATGLTESGVPTIYPGFTSDYAYREMVDGKLAKKNNCQPQRFAVGSIESNDIVAGVRKYSKKLKLPGAFNVG